ncbi:MAG TPA: UDP-glucose 4-epimerase GalE [Candidatus Agrococcus pullicola]|uniref:UDP-glucose 4-epimerase n=1 Tax=Candidatus Agrococcus pullicola TaxID=2838429 RepID=A0A9D1YTA2_9MICO|nr:UDP-glucose 4-epimerase GalE [Candidatus Agrococcus pullicola]
MTRWLVTGGAGYIGAHVAEALLESGRDVTVIDNFASGHDAFVPEGARLVRASILDGSAVEDALSATDGVIHLAGYKYAGESVKHPLHTYTQNVTGTVTLLARMRDCGVENIVFSSSAGVYGTPDVDRVTEATPPAPESPYGESKLIGEWLLWNELRRAELSGEVFRPVALRYFNVIGSATGRIRDTSPHNLVPKVLATLAEGRTPVINGSDYPTPDGTNVRDYVHVQDVALAHVAAAARLETGEPVERVYNLGSGTGSSTREVMEAILATAAPGTTAELGPRRPGDPASIVADGTLAARDLDWRMRRSLQDTIRSAVDAAREQ